ncbi:MAG: hypothetical protein N2323_01365 [candidate division WOR-3 bacterium]|nr:hypothetical protein [candidate division WOR-3 bacterium]MCX7836596.1 hypothetical protein [candidate division WOR-3 bacterium]MDW8114523.1 hypothetical protein [candidate division WOR-3 bacterium]
MARSKSKQKRMRHKRWLKYKRRMEKKKELQKLMSQEIDKTKEAEISEQTKE